jgi:hypothetical protein
VSSGTWQVYLLHFDQPIGDLSKPTGYAQHYTGTARDLAARLAEHRADPDPKIMQEVRRKGIGWQLARTWEGGHERERQIKRQGGARRHCPVCKGREPAAPVAYRVESRPRWRKPQPVRLARDISAVVLDSVTVRLDDGKAPAFLAALSAAERDAWRTGADHRQPGYEDRFAVACDLSRLLADERAAAAEIERCRRLAEAEGWLPAAQMAELEAG